PLFQLRRTYIVFEHEDGIVLIDQHSAHERVLYEQFMRSLERGAAPAQRLLLPLTLHLGPAEGEAFDAHREHLERLGYEVEGFGGHTLIVNTVPMPDRKSTRLNSSHVEISYAVFCLNAPPPPQTHPLSLHDALPISVHALARARSGARAETAVAAHASPGAGGGRSV